MVAVGRSRNLEVLLSRTACASGEEGTAAVAASRVARRVEAAQKTAAQKVRLWEEQTPAQPQKRHFYRRLLMLSSQRVRAFVPTFAEWLHCSPLASLTPRRPQRPSSHGPCVS